MARTPRRRISPTATATATGVGESLRPMRENLPRPAGPATMPNPGPGKPAAAPRRRRSPFGLFNRIPFIGDVIAELRKVTWPTFQETRYLTIVVAIVATAVGIFLGVLDLAFGWIIERIFF